LRKKNIFVPLFLLETSRKEAGTVMVKIANRNREKTDGDFFDDSDPCYERLQVKIIVVNNELFLF